MAKQNENQHPINADAIEAWLDENEVSAGDVTKKEAAAIARELTGKGRASTDDTNLVLSYVAEIADERGEDSSASEEIEEEALEDQEEGSIISSTAKARYKETGRNGKGSGDWLDQTLAHLLLRKVNIVKEYKTKKGETRERTIKAERLDIEGLRAIAKLNGCSEEWLAGKAFDLVANNGQKRMNARNKMETVIAGYEVKGLKVPKKYDPEGFKKAPKDWEPKRKVPPTKEEREAAIAAKKERAKRPAKKAKAEA